MVLLDETVAAILSAADVSKQEWRESITEPTSAAQGMTRVTRTEWTSAMIGKTYREAYMYMNGPESPAWGALREIIREII